MEDALLRWRVAPQAAAPTLAELAAPLFGPDHPSRSRLGPTAPIGPALSVGLGHDAPLLADLGFSGVRWQADYHTTVVTKAIYDTITDGDERRAFKRMFNGARQVIAIVGTWLCDRFGLQQPRARSYCGLLTLLAAKVTAFNLGCTLTMSMTGRHLHSSIHSPHLHQTSRGTPDPPTFLSALTSTEGGRVPPGPSASISGLERYNQHADGGASPTWSDLFLGLRGQNHAMLQSSAVKLTKPVHDLLLARLD